MLQVTSDIHKFFLTVCQAMFVSLSIGLSVRCIFGPLPFNAIFVTLEIWKITLHLATALFNVSAVLQFFIIFNADWIHNFTDQKIFYTSILISFSLLGIDALEYVLVILIDT